jgi:hypothetical protein
MEYYVVELGGREMGQRFLVQGGDPTDFERDYKSLKRAHKFENVNQAHAAVRKSGLNARVIKTQDNQTGTHYGDYLWEPVYDD